MTILSLIHRPIFGPILGTTKEVSFIRCCHGWRRHRTTGRRGARDDDDDDDDDRRFAFVRFGQKTRLSLFLQWMVTVGPPTSYSFLRSSLPFPVDAADASSCRALALPWALCGALEPGVLVIFLAENLEREIMKSNTSKENWGPIKLNFLLVEREILEKIDLAEITSVVLWRKLLAATMSAK